MSAWAEHLRQHRLTKTRGFTEEQEESTVVTGAAHTSKKPLEELEPITLRDLQIPMLHTGRFLVCRTIADAVVAIGTTALVEDTTGDVEHISLHNFRNLNDLEWLKAGVIMVIKEPYLCYDMSQNRMASIRIDSPSDVIFVDDTEKDMLEAVDAMNWYKPEWFNFDQLKQKGNECFTRKDFEAALKYYVRAMRLQPDSAVIHLNRAAALLGLERFNEAYDAA
ncbi:TPR and SET domain containing protein [Aphelenchoides avenae]|nr:TPR and SET domain containing protein [Aphelenchus avenae]